MIDWSEVKTLGDVMALVVGCKTRGEAEELMREYKRITPHAEKNIGFMAGYYEKETAERIWDWFGVRHPVFGTKYPTAIEAFSAGVKKAGEGEAGYGGPKMLDKP